MYIYIYIENSGNLAWHVLSLASYSVRVAWGSRGSEELGSRLDVDCAALVVLRAFYIPIGKRYIYIYICTGVCVPRPMACVCLVMGKEDSSDLPFLTYLMDRALYPGINPASHSQIQRTRHIGDNSSFFPSKLLWEEPASFLEGKAVAVTVNAGWDFEVELFRLCREMNERD
ncbi:hypothetical protein BJX61DRAFT_210667 [Aspergillus egyptiacus]|nr:hypothetical protein BJX61DRAFT_210667 [Aspergillus egyptiacus]